MFSKGVVVLTFSGVTPNTDANLMPTFFDPHRAQNELQY
jgi:hypothetical protein